MNGFSLVQPDSTLHLPRILCLHGGGTNADVFKAQCRALVPQLNNYFRLVFADGPFFTTPHPDILPVYEDFGPFRLWTRWHQDQADMLEETVISEIEYNIRTAMENDTGNGEWVGLLGFSQGANVSASLLYDRQIRIKIGNDKDIEGFAGGQWRFAVLMNGRPPLVCVSDSTRDDQGLKRAGEVPTNELKALNEKISLPTLHVHGLSDPGLDWHRTLLNDFCEESTSSLIEWDGGHRVVLKSWDVRKVANGIFEIAKKTGSLGN